MRLLRKTQKTTFAVFLLLEFFITSAFPASAGLFGGGMKIPSASSIASDLEKRYNLNLGSIQEQAQTFNVGDNKKMVPEVSLFFSPSDPKAGEKISAKAFPMYFSNPEDSLYYTWFLKHKGCDLTSRPSAATRALCDRNSDGRITIEDWKTEAARIIVQNGYDSSATNYSSGSDSDGYQARYGGDNKTNVPDHCYVNDKATGENYELAKAGSTSFSCPSGTTAVCMVGEGTIGSGSNDVLGGNSYFDVTDSDTCVVSGYPTCSSSTPSCGVGSPRCVADPTATTSCGSALSSCSTTASSSVANGCKHLFPNWPSSGSGGFDASEEKFWGTDPNDPDTADNGNKDEANVVGLGQSVFTWNYVTGDQVGVVVEGTSMIPTKHNDSSYMIMWAFSKKDCQPDSFGSYTKSIKGYNIKILTSNFDLNTCIERNLVDPTQGGQATNLEVGVTATPENPVNDETTDKGGDTVIAQASVSNIQQSLSNAFFDWKVEISDNVQFSSTIGDVADITGDLRDLGLLGNTKGNALDSIGVKLDIQNNAQTIDLLGLSNLPLSRYLSGNVGYLRFRVSVTENFSSGVTRKGKSDVIVKFTSSGKKISAYKAQPGLSGGIMKVALPGSSGLICNDDALDRAVCRIIKNEIIGLKIDPSGLSNFYWTINGSPLACSNKVSASCSDTVQNEINFFPVTGNVGDTYTVAVTANNVSTGNVLTLTRTFNVVQPTVTTESLNRDIVWPRFLGQYKDITGQATVACPNGLCNDYSTSIFEAFSGSQIAFKTAFIPSFLGYSAKREWTVDGAAVADTDTYDASGNINGGQISFTATKLPLEIYNISLTAQVAQSEDTRRALLDIWNVSPFESSEINFAVSNQVELQEPGLVEGPFQGERKYLAAIASYIPASVMFTFRILLSAVLVLFTTSFLLSLFQDRRMKAFVASIPEKRS